MHGTNYKTKSTSQTPDPYSHTRKIPVEQVREQLLKWHSHIDNICKHLSRNIFLVSQLRHYVDSDPRKILFQAHLLSHINYPSSRKINPTRSILVTYGKNKQTKYLFPLHKQFKFNQSVTTFKIHTGKASPYLRDFLH